LRSHSPPSPEAALSSDRPSRVLFQIAPPTGAYGSGEKPARRVCDTGHREENELMKLGTNVSKLNWIVTAVALTLATVAAQSPFF
jgi:hypothetical protein